MSNLKFLLTDADEPERQARLRELRVLAALYLGYRNPVTIALTEAITDPSAIWQALELLDVVPALRRRRLLCAYAALLMPRRGGS